MILAQYLFPSASDLTNRVVRCYATGRFRSQTGTTVTLVAANNGTTLCSVSISQTTSTTAQGWYLWAHFYVSSTLPSAGAYPFIGANIHAGFTWNHTLSTTTGVEVAKNYLSLMSNPYSTIFNPNASNTVSVSFNPDPSDNLEVHTAYMEAL